MVACLFLVNQGKPVAQRDDDLLDALVLFHAIVKFDDATGLGFALSLGVHDLAGPQGIVGDDISAGIQIVHHQVIILDILAFVGVNEHEVIAFAQCRHDVAGIADVESHAFAVG